MTFSYTSFHTGYILNFIVQHEASDVGQVLTVTEGFPIFDTQVRPFSSMNPLMFTKACLLVESFFTLTTLIKFLSSVSSLMFNKR